MQIPRVQDAVETAERIARGLRQSLTEVFIAPSANSIYSVGKIVENTNLKVAGQNIHYLEKGAFTGQNSILSLINAGCQFCILGHSEPRRIFKETDQIINFKVLKVLEKGLKPVLCVGETAKERADGLTQDVIFSQLSNSLNDVTTNQMTNLIIAYEPVWAINNKFLNPDTEIKPATPKQATDAHQSVRNWVRKKYNDEVAENIPIIYGGSMKESNAKELLEIEDIDGGLIGGASLSADQFIPIIRIAEELLNKGSSYEWENNTLKFKD
jgi:triosephosphate isomerase